MRNTTSKADGVADLLAEGKVGLNFLGDDLFHLIGHAGDNAVYNPLSRQIYLRRSDANLFSTIVHEGTHALDHRDGISRTMFEPELRAHFFQRQFEMSTTGVSRYPTMQSIRERILRVYDSPYLHQIFVWPQ